MRESIGGTWLTGIVICFLALFAAFLAYAINYTKAFRVKDRIIQIIEESEGYVYSSVDLEDMSLTEINAMLESEDSERVGTAGKILSFIKQMGYNYSNDIHCADSEISGPGYCLQKYCITNDTNNTKRVYYKVTSYISLTVPVVDVVVKIPISGETNSLYFDKGGMDYDDLDHHCYRE